VAAFIMISPPLFAVFLLAARPAYRTQSFLIAKSLTPRSAQNPSRAQAGDLLKNFLLSYSFCTKIAAKRQAPSEQLPPLRAAELA
jgi:hypothetical protein